MFSTELPVLFSFVQVYGYLGTLEKSQKIYKKSAFRKLPPGQRGATGQPGDSLARPSSWPRHLPSWLGPTPPAALLWLYLFSRRRNPRTEVTFPIYVAEPPQPSVLLRRANLEAALASGEGKLSPSSSSSPLHHPSMTSPLMCE